MIGALITNDADTEDVARYFRALRRAQRDIDIEPERYTHYFLRELPERYHGMIDVRRMGPGERLVFEAYTREVFERTHKWIDELGLFDDDRKGGAGYVDAVTSAAA